MIALETPEEIAMGRAQTLEALSEILKRTGRSPFELVGRWGTQLDENQVFDLRAWLEFLKAGGGLARSWPNPWDEIMPRLESGVCADE